MPDKTILQVPLYKWIHNNNTSINIRLFIQRIYLFRVIFETDVNTTLNTSVHWRWIEDLETNTLQGKRNTTTILTD